MSVRAPGILDEMEFSDQRLRFNVRPEANKEKDFLTCDENLLAEMSEISGGSFFREENFKELKDALRPISSGRVVITEIILWQSFGWLIFVVFILGLEMFLRKAMPVCCNHITHRKLDMNTELDPIITRKLDDFRLRRRNLILLRGLCSGVLSFLGTFVLIALIDYLTEGRMSGDLRSGLSFIGYFLVIALLWKTCVGPLLQLPSSKKLARLLEQSSPDLREDLLSAVELGISNQSSTDSEIFRETGSTPSIDKSKQDRHQKCSSSRYS